jgi:tryptophan synthase alpha chain
MKEKIMNKIDKKFQNLNGEKALITFITGGHFGYNTTEKLVLTMEKAGADIIEIGVPFSDPIAEGPVIQRSSMEAISQGATLAGIFDTVKKLREKTDIPILLMLYINSVFGYGKEKFFEKCNEAQIDGVIVPDLPFEEYDEIADTADKHGVYSVRLVTPTSKERIKKIASGAKGFLYCVSSVGVTGMRNSFNTDFEKFFTEIKKHSTAPNCIGFGISNPEQAKKMSGYADGVIVGSAIVKLVSEFGENSIDRVYEFTRAIKDAIK